MSVPTYENVACPITGLPAARALFVDTDWGRVYVCCQQCIAKVKVDPDAAYRIAYPVTQMAKNPVCPVTGEDLGSNPLTMILQGREIAIKDADVIPKARANAQIVLVKVNRKGVVDVGNATCPISGKPVIDNAYCLVGSDLIHLSSPTLVDDVKKDPVKALEAAKAIAAKEAEAKKHPPVAPPAPKGKTKPPTK